MRKLLLPVILFIYSGVFAQESGSIKGTIYDRQTNENLSGASIAIKGTTNLTTSGTDGAFQLRNVTPGKVILLFSFIGYESYEIVLNVAAGETTSVQAGLEMNIQAGQEIVVSAFNRPEKITNAPASISVIGVKELSQFPGANVSEMVSKIQGIEYVRTGVDGINFNARGMNSAFNNKVFLMVDGRNSMGVGSGGLPMFNSGSVMKEDIERMEIVLGPQSSLFGPNAHNAVFNIITKDPRKYQGTTVSMSAGSRSQFSGRLRQAAKINEKWAYKFSGEILTGREFPFVDSIYAGGGDFGPQVVIPEKGVDPEFRRLRGEGHVYYNIKPAMDIIISGGASNNSFLQVTTGGRNQMRDVSYSFLQARLVHKNFFLNIYNAWASFGTSYALGPYTRDFWNRTHSTITDTSHAFYSSRGRLLPEEAEINARRLTNRFKEENQRINADAQYNYSFKKQGIFMVAGLSYQKDKPYSFGINLVDNFQRIYVTQYGAVLQFEKTLPKGFSFVSAGRLDNHSNFGNVVSPKFALLKKFRDITARVGWARAFAMPSILNQYSRIGGSLFGNGAGVTYIPNLTKMSDSIRRTTTPLVPERVSTWEAGIRGNVLKNLYLDINGYYGNSRNFISPQRTVSGRAEMVNGIPVTPTLAGQVNSDDTLRNARFSTFFNYGEVSSYGIDAGLDFRFNNKINFILRYSWFGSSIIKNNLVNDANNDSIVSPEERSLNAPRNRGVAMLNFQNLFRHQLYASISARFVQQYDFYSGDQVGTKAGEGSRLRPKNLDRGPLGGFTTIDLQAGYQLNEMVKLGIGITNLLNTDQLEFVGSHSIDRLIMFEIKVHVPNGGRSK
jgi:outer membrane receptor for ferrienterochelin and colicins